MKKTTDFDRNEEPIVLSKHLIDLLLSQPNAPQLIALYIFYYYTAKWQKTNIPKATNSYVAKGIGISKNTLEKYKAELIRLKLIENIVDTDSNGKIVGHYIQVNFIWTRESIQEFLPSPQNLNENNVTPSPQEPHLPKNWGSNALNTVNINALSVNSLRSNKLFSDGKIKPNQFDYFWKYYPKHTSKGLALTKWNQLCQKNDRPTWKEIKAAILSQKESEQWKDPEFIANPSTWLNQSRWLDDPTQMKGPRKVTSWKKNEEDIPKYNTELPDRIKKLHKS